MQSTSSSRVAPLQGGKHMANYALHWPTTHVLLSGSPGCGSLSTHTAESAASNIAQPVATVSAARRWAPMVIERLQQELQPKKCKSCLGTGFLICEKCQGRAKVGLTLPGEASTVRSCTMCSKRGRCRCQRCRATGLENNWLWQPAADPGWGPRGN